MKLRRLASRRPPGCIHYTELQPVIPGSQLEIEWETYRREVGRLLAEGHEGKHVLIKGDHIIGVFQTNELAREEGDKRFGSSGFFAKHIHAWEPLLRVGWR